MTDSRPNIILIMTDQQRGDAMGHEPGQIVQTPQMDHMATAHVRFRHGYSACPQCIPARRSLMSGMTPHGHGVYCNHDTIMHGPTLPGELSKAGYHTHLCGKLHLFPKRKLYGFMSADWADGPHGNWTGDFGTWLREQGVQTPNPAMAHGCNQNGWVARPYHMDERFHFTNWTTDCALRFLERRDPTTPFFLKVSYHQPHQPCCPPQCYWDRYINDPNLPMPVIGDWAKTVDEAVPGSAPATWRCVLPEQQMRQFRAGYYGCINHIDDQIGRIMMACPRNTVIIFTSDHGDMLGDHEWNRKTRGLEGSARIPFLMQFPRDMGIAPAQQRDEVVELMDIMPTCLDIAGVPIPETVEGRSLLPLLRGESQDWRSHLHGECSTLGGEPGGTQWLTDGKRKYIWDSMVGRELYFDLEHDPLECHNLIDDPTHQAAIALWRERLVEELADRPEGFVVDGQLQDGVRTRPCTPALSEYRKTCGFFPEL